MGIFGWMLVREETPPCLPSLRARGFAPLVRSEKPPGPEPWGGGSGPCPGVAPTHPVETRRRTPIDRDIVPNQIPNSRPCWAFQQALGGQVRFWKTSSRATTVATFQIPGGTFHVQRRAHKPFRIAVPTVSTGRGTALHAVPKLVSTAFVGRRKSAPGILERRGSGRPSWSFNECESRRLPSPGTIVNLGLRQSAAVLKPASSTSSPRNHLLQHKGSPSLQSQRTSRKASCATNRPARGGAFSNASQQGHVI